MLSMRDKILSHMEKEVQKFKLEANVNFGAANTGLLYIMDGLETILTVKFSFSDYDFSVGFHREQECIKAIHKVRYEDGEGIQEVQTFIHQYCAKYKEKAS